MGSTLRAVVVYTGLRLVLFVGAVGLLYLAGLRSFLLALVALLLSGVLSALLLSRQRIAMGDAVAGRIGAARRSFDRRAAAEDEMADRLQAEQQAAQSTGQQAPPADDTGRPSAADPPAR